MSDVKPMNTKNVKKLAIFGLNTNGLYFDNVKGLTCNTREITFTGTYECLEVPVYKLKPSGLLVLPLEYYANLADSDDPNDVNDYVEGQYYHPVKPAKEADGLPATDTPPAPESSIKPMTLPIDSLPPVPATPATPATDTKIYTRQEVIDILMAKQGKGVDVGKVLNSLGFHQFSNVPDTELGKVVKVFLDIQPEEVQQ